jgi:hypothetical protein
MTTKENDAVKAAARMKLKRIQQSPSYRGFFDEAAIEAFGRVEATAFAGKPLSRETLAQL